MKYENLTSRWIPECGGWSLFSCAMRLSSWKENNPPPKTAQRQMRNNFIRYQPEANCDLPHWRCFLIHLIEVNNIEHMQTMCKMICKSISRDLTCNVCTIREHSTFPLPCCCRSLAPKLKRSNYSSLPCMLHLEAALRATFLALVWWRFKQLVASIRLSMKIS